MCKRTGEMGRVNGSGEKFVGRRVSALALPGNRKQERLKLICMLGLCGQ